jgi:hypothetical protein
MFLELSKTRKRWIAIDETFLGMMNFSRRKWKVKGDLKSENLRPVVPRVTIIGAISNMGESFMSILQDNTDQDVIQLFLLELFEILDRNSPGWKRDSFLFWDCASYHCSESTLSMLREYDVPVVQLGAYSYLQNPIELYWAMLKDADLNPTDAKTSKSKFNIIIYTKKSIL